MLFELRQYWCKSGKRNEWVSYMEETIIPFQVTMGMVVVGSFIDEEDPDHYVWIRRFDSEAERERLYKAVYESETWVTEMMPKVVQMLDRDRSVISSLHATPKSVIS